VYFILNPPKSIFWGPENEALLKSLRLSAGVDLATLARRNIVSTTQVRQLEEGGDSSFYSPEIKFSVGKKLLKYLGHDLKVEMALEVPISTSPDLAQANTPYPETLDSEKTSTSVAVETLVSTSNENLAPHFVSQNSSIAVPLFLSGVALFVGVWFWLGQEPPSPQEVTKSPLPESKAETKVDLNADALPDKSTNSPIPENVAISLETTSTPKELAKSDAQPACNWSSAEEVIQPDSPRKAGEYVHVEAQQAMTVCIMDGQKRVATLKLQVGEGRSIYGPSPFRVYSADLRWVKVYFQGQYIKLPFQDTTQIKLTAAPDFAVKN
jgi:transcriptional regulator with XRE-family HTH domain